MSYSLKNIVKGSGFYISGEFLTKSINFLIIPIYSRVLSTSDYGIIGYFQMLISLFFITFMMGMDGAQMRLYFDYKNNEEKVGEFLFSINSFLIVLLLNICITLTIFGKSLFQPLFSSLEINFYPLLVISLWIVFFQCLNRMVFNYDVTLKNYSAYFKKHLINFGLTTTLIFSLVVLWKRGAAGHFQGILLAYILFFLITYPQYFKKFIRKLNFSTLKSALQFSLPTLPHSIAGILFIYIDRMILLKFVSLSEIGIYTVGYQLGTILSVIVVSINTAWAPSFYNMMSDDKHDKAYETCRTFYFWMLAVGIICLIGELWCKELIHFILPGAYYGSIKIVPIILFSYFLNGMYFFAVGPIFHFKKTKYLPLITISTAMLNIWLNFLLIPKFGIVGAAYATLIGYVFLLVSTYLISKKLFDPRYELVKTTALTALVFFPLLFSQDFHQNAVFNQLAKCLILISYIATCYLFFKNHLKSNLVSAVSLIKNNILHIKKDSL